MRDTARGRRVTGPSDANASDAPTGSIEALFQNRYQVLERLGSGGFGEVYKAVQAATGQLVAIKILRVQPAAELGSRQPVARFMREMKLCARLHHPNIVRLIDAGERGGSRLYTVFEYVPGKNLADVLAEQGVLEPAEAVHLMAQVLDALSTAHDQGVIHRDLKPQNIMVSASGARRNAIVLDFGIGAYVGLEQDEDWASLTGTSQIFATPPYAAPEQLRGLPPMPRSDLYSWGLVLLECLTGERVMSGSPTDVMLKQLGPEPIPLPAALRRHELGELLRQVIDKDVDRRGLTAREALKALARADVSTLEPLAAMARPAARARATEDTPASGGRTTSVFGWKSIHGERRQITAIGCSLSVAGSDALDVEDVDEMLTAGRRVCQEIAGRSGGQVGSAAGDRLLIYFGYHRAQEHDALQAARAALAIAAGFGRRGALSRGDAHLEARVGLHTGLVIARQSEDSQPGVNDVVGATPQLASGLGALADPGTVLVSAATYPLLKQRFRVGPESAHHIPGVPQPIRARCLVSEDAEALSLRTHVVRTGLPMVGRDAELQLLRERWRTARGGNGQTILITGDPGIGKSRLAGDLIAGVEADGGAWMECHCAPESQNSSLRPIVDRLERIVGPEATGELRAAALERLLARCGFDLRQTMPLFTALLSLPSDPRYPALDISPDRQRRLLLDAILALLVALAEETPLLFAVEDLHWADSTTLELLAGLVDYAPTAPICCVFTARPGFEHGWKSSDVLQIQLSPLGRDQVRQMATALTGGKRLPDDVIAEIVRRTDGVSLFVEELTKILMQSGSLVERADCYELVGSLAELAIPSTVRDLLSARLDAQGPAKQTAQLASALGREFHVEVLRAIAPLSEDRLTNDLEVLVRSDLLHHRRRRTPSYMFKHALIRDAAYESIPKPARVEIHASIAAALEAHFPETVDARPELLAHHHAAANQKRQALEYAEKAAAAALLRSANAEAIGHATQALEWIDALGDTRERTEKELALNAILTPALIATRGHGSPEVKTTAERSRKLLDLVPDSRYTAPSLWALSTYHSILAHRAESRQFAEQLLELARQGGEIPQEVPALALVGQCQWLEGQFEEARHTLERSVSLYDAGGPGGDAFRYGADSFCWAKMVLGQVLHPLGFAEEALACAHEAVAHAREIKHTHSLGMTLLYLAMLHHLRRDSVPCGEASRELLELCERTGLPFGPYATFLSEWALQDVEASTSLLAFLEDHQLRLGLTYYRSLIAESEAARGNLDYATALIETSLAAADQTDERYYLSELWRLKGTFLAAAGGATALPAEACFDRAIADARQYGKKAQELSATVDLCRLLQARSQVAEARARLEPLIAWFGGSSGTPGLGAARELLATLS